MQYLRFISDNNTPGQGVLGSDGQIELLEGDILGPHVLTGEKCSVSQIKQYLPQIDVPNIIALGLNYREHATEFGNEDSK